MVKVVLAKNKSNEFALTLPFKSKKEMIKAKRLFKKLTFPERKKHASCSEFYLQYLSNDITVKDIEPNKNNYNEDIFIRKYGTNEGVKRYNLYREKTKIKNTLKGFKNKYGEDGKKLYFEKNKRLSVGIESLKERGFSDNEIVNIRNEHSKSFSSKKNFIRRHGEIEGLKRYDEYRTKVTCWSVKYWIRKGYTEEEAKEKISNLQRRDLSHFILKYGKEGPKIYGDYVKRKTKPKGISIVELNAYNVTKRKYDDAIHGYHIFDKENNRSYIVDIYIPSKNLVIEILGDYYHCNPKKWPNNRFNKTIKKLASEVWKKDKDRKTNLERLRYNTLFLWVSDISKRRKIFENYLDLIDRSLK